MLYLVNAIYKQSVALPILATHSGDYTLMLQDVLDGSWHKAEVASADKGSLSYNLYVELPDGLHRGEYLCELMRGGKVVAKALAFVGEYQQGIDYLQRSEDVGYLQLTSDVEYLQRMEDVGFTQHHSRVEYVQRVENVEFLEYDEMRKATLDVMPDYVWLTEDNAFSAEFYILSNVEWNIE